MGVLKLIMLGMIKLQEMYFKLKVDCCFVQEMPKSVSRDDDMLLALVKMGFKEQEALVAIERLGPDASLDDLVDFIGVAQLVKAEDALLPPEDKVINLCIFFLNLFSLQSLSTINILHFEFNF
jgi:hypothetical protein